MILLGLVLSLGAFEPRVYNTHEVSGWTVAMGGDERCFMALDYEGPGSTTLLYALEADGSNSLLINNDNWSIVDGQEYHLTYRLSAGSYDDHVAIGSVSGEKKGFGTKFERKFTDYLAQSNYMHVYKEGKIVDRLNLSGSGAAVLELKKCFTTLQYNVGGAARDKARLQDIPADPFAK